MREFWPRAMLKVWKNLFDGVNFVDRVNKKLQTLYAFLIFPVNGNVFTSLMESWCNPGKVSERLISARYTRNFGAKTHFSTNALYILHLYKHTTEYISERASQQAGETCFLNSEMPKKIHAFPSTWINKSTEWHPRIPSYLSPPFFTLLQIIPLQPAFIPSLQVRSGMETESFVSDCLLINTGRPFSVFKR